MILLADLRLNERSSFILLVPSSSALINRIKTAKTNNAFMKYIIRYAIDTNQSLDATHPVLVDVLARLSDDKCFDVELLFDFL